MCSRRRQCREGVVSSKSVCFGGTQLRVGAGASEAKLSSAEVFSQNPSIANFGPEL